MNLRRWITALAILAVFTAVAGAQVTSNQVSCTASPASTPNIRAEGLTERAGAVPSLAGRCRKQAEPSLEASRGNPVSGRSRLSLVNASAKPGGDVQDPIETKIHPRRKLRMQSSSQTGESSSTQPLKGRIRGNPGTQQRWHRGQSDSGQLE
jgi:hypothetical protein